MYSGSRQYVLCTRTYLHGTTFLWVPFEGGKGRKKLGGTVSNIDRPGPGPDPNLRPRRRPLGD